MICSDTANKNVILCAYRHSFLVFFSFLYLGQKACLTEKR